MKDESFLPKKKMRVIPKLSSFIFSLSTRKRLSSLETSFQKFGCASAILKHAWHCARLARTFIFSLSTFLLLLTSCTEVIYYTTEQLVPPEVTPKQTACSVGIVNNFSQNNVIIVNEDATIVPCDADSVKEEIAITFAESGVLDRVVVLDSLLYPPGSVTPHFLSQAEVNRLCQQMEVGMLYSIEFACLTFNPASYFIGRPLDIHLCARIYTPDSVGGTKVLDKQRIEKWADDLDEMRELMPTVPAMLAEVAIAPYLPSWKERERIFYYDRLCYELREGKVYVKEDNWEAAAAHWRALSNSKQRIRRFASAYNMALYYEMTDSLDQAIASLDLAAEIAVKKNEKSGIEIQLIDTAFVKDYREVLVNRKKEIARIEEFWKKQSGR